MAVPKKRTSISRKKIRKNIWKKKSYSSCKRKKNLCSVFVLKSLKKNLDKYINDKYINSEDIENLIFEFRINIEDIESFILEFRKRILKQYLEGTKKYLEGIERRYIIKFIKIFKHRGIRVKGFNVKFRDNTKDLNVQFLSNSKILNVQDIQIAE